MFIEETVVKETFKIY